MRTPGRLTLAAAAILFVIFFSNVSWGALGYKPWLNDIQEMLTLLASSILFAVSVLQMEADASQDQTGD